MNARLVSWFVILGAASLCYPVVASQQPETSVLFEKSWTVNEKLPEYVFKVIGTREPVPELEGKANFSTERIDVTRSGSGKIVQSLTTPKSDGQWIVDIANDDFNFDGYRDIRLPANLCLASRFCRNWYLYWLFDPKLGQFVESKVLEKMRGDFVLNPIDKSFSVNDIELQESGSEILTDSFYKWEKGVPVLFKKVETHHKNGETEDLKLTLIMIHGTWKEIGRERVLAH